MMLSSNRRRQRSELRPHPKEEAMSHALATVLHRGRKAASNIMAACLAPLGKRAEKWTSSTSETHTSSEESMRSR
jgi:hypothetical protein